MIPRSDIQLQVNDGSAMDVAIANGDFVTGDSREQEAALFAILQPGEMKEYPLMGAGIERYIKRRAGGNSLNAPLAFKAALQQQLEADGFGDVQITVTDNLSDFKIEIP